MNFFRALLRISVIPLFMAAYVLMIHYVVYWALYLDVEILSWQFILLTVGLPILVFMLVLFWLIRLWSRPQIEKVNSAVPPRI